MTVFQTTDLGLAAALLYFRFHPDTVEIGNMEGRGTFTFADSPEIQDVIDRYWKDKIMVEPKAYNAALRQLKSRLYTRSGSRTI